MTVTFRCPECKRETLSGEPAEPDHPEHSAPRCNFHQGGKLMVRVDFEAEAAARAQATVDKAAARDAADAALLAAFEAIAFKPAARPAQDDEGDNG